jgi:hypothetical protein
MFSLFPFCHIFLPLIFFFLFGKGENKDKDGEKGGGRNQELVRGEEKTNGETKRIVDACCLTLSYLFMF